MLFNGKYYNKPGHLGMTTEELKEALAGGGGGIFLVTLSFEDGNPVLNKNFTEIMNGIKAGQYPVLIAPSIPKYANMLLWYAGNDSAKIMFRHDNPFADESTAIESDIIMIQDTNQPFPYTILTPLTINS